MTRGQNLLVLHCALGCTISEIAEMLREEEAAVQRDIHEAWSALYIAATANARRDGASRYEAERYWNRFRETAEAHEAAGRVMQESTHLGAVAVDAAYGHPQLPEDGCDLALEVERFRRALVVEALRRCDGNRNKAAGLLRMNRTTLVEYMKKVGLM